MDAQLITTIGTLFGVLLVVWKIAKGFRDDLQRTTDLLFKRFDEHKESVDKKLFYINDFNERKYAQISICDITRQNFTKSVDEMNRKLDMLLEERRNQ